MSILFLKKREKINKKPQKNCKKPLEKQKSVCYIKKVIGRNNMNRVTIHKHLENNKYEPSIDLSNTEKRVFATMGLSKIADLEDVSRTISLFVIAARVKTKNVAVYHGAAKWIDRQNKVVSIDLVRLERDENSTMVAIYKNHGEHNLERRLYAVVGLSDKEGKVKIKGDDGVDTTYSFRIKNGLCCSVKQERVVADKTK